MIDPLIHVALFVLAALAIVFAGATFTEVEDAPLLRALPRKVGWFAIWCALLCVLIVVLEHSFASTS